MKPLVESTETDDLAKALAKRGYVFLRGFLQREHLFTVRDVLLSVMERRGWLSGPKEEARPSDQVHRIGSGEFLECIEALMREESFHALASSRMLVDLMRELLGTDVYVHPRKMLRLNYPERLNPIDRIPPHQDLYYVKGDRDVLTGWIALGDYDVGHGGLEILEGSHLEGLQPVAPNSEGRFNCTASQVDSEDPRWTTGAYRAGDLLVFHALTVHRGGCNASTCFRLSMDCRYSPSDGAINSDELLPPYHPNVAAWEHLSVGWLEPQRFRVPEALHVESPAIAPSIVAERPSRFGRV